MEDDLLWTGQGQVDRELGRDEPPSRSYELDDGSTIDASQSHPIGRLPVVEEMGDIHQRREAGDHTDEEKRYCLSS
jgi:hypothetical protein